MQSALTFFIIFCFQCAQSIRLRSKGECIIHGKGDVSNKPLWTGETTVWGNDVWNRTVSPESTEELATIIRSVPFGSSLVVGGSNSALGWVMQPATKYSTLVSMWKFKKFWIDVCEETITVQAGVTYADIGPALAENGLVVPFYYLFKRFTLIGTMSSGSSPLMTGQVRGPADFVKSMKVINGHGDISVIDVETDEVRASAWLNSVGDLGVVLEATFTLEKDHNLQSSCKDDAGIEAALKEHDEYSESTVDITPSDPQCSDPMSKTRMISICKFSSVGIHSKESLDLAPLPVDMLMGGLKTADLSYEPLQCPSPAIFFRHNTSSDFYLASYMGHGSSRRSPVHEIAFLDTSEGSIATRSVSTDMMVDAPWTVPQNMPHITTIFVPKDDIEVTLAEIEEIREQKDISFRLNSLSLHNYPGSRPSILLSHKDSHKDAFMIYFNTFNADGLTEWTSRLFYRLICKHKISVGWKLANNLPRKWIGAQESSFPSLQGLAKFKEISVLEDPFDRFSNVLAQEMFKRLEGNFAPRMC